mmetsp:Transcript_770/g.1223  ORF Transcript_770/g.1223 Transcript_770/m.1223 type:complete len:235 (-) Transcript_770:120-824(-)
MASEHMSLSVAEYEVPAANKDVWKKFGTNTAEGQALRKLYGGSSAVTINYPRVKTQQRQEPEKVVKACPQRAKVNVPQMGRPDRNMERHTYLPLPGRKPEAVIRAETQDYERELERVAPGKNRAAMAEQLQNKFQFGGGRALPKGAMGHSVAVGAVPKPLPGRQQEAREDDGMTAEQREMFQEICDDVQHLQDEIAKFQGMKLANGAPCVEELELQNKLKAKLRDIETLMRVSD